jgi:hypothetical protein
MTDQPTAKPTTANRATRRAATNKAPRAAQKTSAAAAAIMAPAHEPATRRAATNKAPRAAKKTSAAAAAIMAPAHEPADLSDVGLNLDTLEREGSKGPFVFLHGGRRFVMTDPFEIDWKDLINALSNPFVFIRNCMSVSDHEAFIAGFCPTWKMNAIVDAYLKHHGLPTVGELGALPR